MIVCRTLGPVEVTIESRAAPPELVWRRHLALLVYLARSPRRVRTRDHLIGLLWPDKEESAARHSLREAVRILRRTLGESAVDTTGQQVRLADEAVRLDTDELEAWIAADDWTGAAKLVVGEFMEGFSVPDASAFEDWLASERLAWRDRSVHVLVRHGEALLHSGAARVAADAARRALALDPLSEVALRLQMRSAVLLGDRAAALSALESFEPRLRAATGVGLQQETRELAERIRRGRMPVQADVPPPRPEAGAESRRAPLVGRSAELSTLCAAWETARDGGGATLMVIEGDPGLGKTRILDELVQRAAMDGAAVSVVRSVQADLLDTYSGLLGLARGGLVDAPGLAGARPESISAFAARLPEWSERFPGVRAADPAPVDQAFRDIVAAVVEEQPVFLATDDAQWLDRDSLLILEAALRDMGAARIALGLTVVPHADREEIDRLRSHVGRECAGAAITLAPLSSEEVRALCRWALPAYRDDEIERVSRRVLVDSAGLPLLAVELLHAIALGLDLKSAGAGAWPSPFKTLEQSLPGDLPDAVVAAIRVGFRRLSRNAQTVLAAAAVLGDRVKSATLQRTTGLAAADVNAALDELEWQRWLVAEPRGYGFVARIVRDVVARDMLTKGQRQRILEVVERAAGDS